MRGSYPLLPPSDTRTLGSTEEVWAESSMEQSSWGREQQQRGAEFAGESFWWAMQELDWALSGHGHILSWGRVWTWQQWHQLREAGVLFWEVLAVPSNTCLRERLCGATGHWDTGVEMSCGALRAQMGWPAGTSTVFLDLYTPCFHTNISCRFVKCNCCWAYFTQSQSSDWRIH